MKALIYHGPHHVSVDTMPDPALEAPDDIIPCATTTAICGSDLHFYRGEILGTHHGDTFGHEFMGKVVEVGSEVIVVRRDDRVVIPLVIACGNCFLCRLQQYATCESTNSGRGVTFNRKGISSPAALFGYSDLYGGIPGGQAEYVWIPEANIGPLKVPDILPDGKVLLLLDILLTTWQAVKNAEVKPGSSVVTSGAGPVGLLCTSCARLDGVGQIFTIDYNDYRPDFAQQRYDVTLINFDAHDDPIQWIIDNAPGYRGVDAVIDAVGFEVRGSLIETVLSNLKIKGSSGKALYQCIAVVRRGGIVSVPGVYVGLTHGFMFGDAFDKGLIFRMGQAHVHVWLLDPLALTEQGLFTPEKTVTYHMSLEEAVCGYQISEKREEACCKVIPMSGMQPGKAAL